MFLLYERGTNELFLLHVQFGCAMLLLFVGGVLLLLLMIMEMDWIVSNVCICFNSVLDEYST